MGLESGHRLGAGARLLGWWILGIIRARSRLGAAAFDSYVYPDGGQALASYQVAPGSPGAVLLTNYELAQTRCGAPALVVIFGPDNSVICAQPNNLVGSGEYGSDSSNLTLVSQ